MHALSEFINFIQCFKFDYTQNDMILGKNNDSYTPINMSDIVYFNAINNASYANLSSGMQYTTKYKLYELEESLAPNYFVRINKSEIVNIKKISLITPMFKGKLLLYLDGYKTPFDVSRSYNKNFKERLGL